MIELGAAHGKFPVGPNFLESSEFLSTPITSDFAINNVYKATNYQTLFFGCNNYTYVTLF